MSRRCAVCSGYGAGMADKDVDLRAMTPRELLSLYSRILTELIARRVVWSRNAPAGDYAELLVAEAFGGVIAKASAKSWDVRVGERLLQVKCRVIEPGSTKSQTFSPFRSFGFAACVFVVLNASTYEVTWARQVDQADVEAASSLSAWVAGRRVTVKQVLALTTADDVTDALRAAQNRLDEQGRSALHELD